jgi:hypothetical protein
LLAHGRWFSLGTLASSITKTGCHDIAEILLKVALNTKNESICSLFPCASVAIHLFYKRAFQKEQYREAQIL